MLCLFSFFFFTASYNFEEARRAWRQRAVETLPPTQHCLAGHTLVESVKEERRFGAERGRRDQRSSERADEKG